MGQPCRIAAKQLRRDAGATGHNVRERGTGERRDGGPNRLPGTWAGMTQQSAIIYRRETQDRKSRGERGLRLARTDYDQPWQVGRALGPHHL